MNKSLILTIFASVLLMSVFVIATSDGNNTSLGNSTEDDDSDSNNATDDDEDDDSNSTLDDDSDDLNETVKRYYAGLNESEREAFKARAEALRERNKEIKEQIKENIKDRIELRKDIRKELKEGENWTMSKEQLILRKIDKEILELIAKKVRIQTRLNLSENNESELTIHLNNGRNVTIKIMPETASERALARLRLKNCNETRNCTIVLKEVGKGNNTRAVYEARAEKKFKVLWLFKNKEYVSTQIDSETGEVIKTHKPWWGFMASEEDETEDDNSNNETDTNSSA